jgi:hypothetical protein
MPTLDFNPDTWTIADIEDFEEASGELFTEVANRFATDGVVSGKALKTLVWILQRQTNPEASIEDARAIKLADLKVESNGKRPTKAGRRAGS